MILNYFHCAFRMLHYSLNISLEWFNLSFHNVFSGQLMMLASRLEVLILRDCYITSTSTLLETLCPSCAPVSTPQKPSQSHTSFLRTWRILSVKPLCIKYSENLIYLSWYIKVEWRPDTKDGSPPFVNVKSQLDMGTSHVHFHSGNIYLGRGKLCLKN